MFISTIGRITPAGAITEFPVPAPTGVANAPLVMTLTSGPDGNFWFDLAVDKIGRITPAGIITEFPIPNNDGVDEIMFGPDGNLWFIVADDTAKNRIGQITPAGVITEFPAPTPLSIIHGFTFGPDGNLWFTDDAWEGHGARIGRFIRSSATQNRAIGSNISGNGSKDPKTIEAALVPYVGEWGHHGYGLTINANGTGKDTQSFGFICDNGNRACDRTGTLTFTLESGAIIGTYTQVSYDPGVPLVYDEVRIGDSFQLALAPHNRLIWRWLGTRTFLGSMSLCGPHTPLKFWNCGA